MIFLMTGQTTLWFGLAMLFLGFGGGVVVGVIVDHDKVINQIFKRIRYKKGTGDLIVDGELIEPEPQPKKRRKLFKRKSQT